MRFVVLRKSEKWMESGQPPDPTLVAAMQQYDDEMRKAGVLIAGINIIDVPSMEEAIAWMKRCPTLQGDNIEARFEIRPVIETPAGGS